MELEVLTDLKEALQKLESTLQSLQQDIQSCSEEPVCAEEPAPDLAPAPCLPADPFYFLMPPGIGAPGESLLPAPDISNPPHPDALPIPLSLILKILDKYGPGVYGVKLNSGTPDEINGIILIEKKSSLGRVLPYRYRLPILKEAARGKGKEEEADEDQAKPASPTGLEGLFGMLRFYLPSILRMITGKSYVMPNPDEPIADYLQRIGFFQDFRLLNSKAAQSDIEKITAYLDKISEASGQQNYHEANRKMAQNIAYFSAFLPYLSGSPIGDKILRIYSQVLPDAQLPLVSYIRQAYGPYLPPEQADKLADSISEIIQRDPRVLQGFTTVEFGQLFANGVASGLIMPPQSAKNIDAWKQHIMDYMQPYAAAKLLAKYSGIPASMENLVKITNAVQGMMPGAPRQEIAREILTLANIKQMGGFYQAALKSSVTGPAGIIPVLSPEEAEKRFGLIMAKARTSGLGNMLGAARRMLRDGIVRPNGAIARLLNDAALGRMPTIFYQDFVRLAQMDGVHPSVALNYLSDRINNGLALNLNDIAGVMANSYKYDLAPMAAALNRAYAFLPPAQRQAAVDQALNRYLQSRGFLRGVREYQQLLSPQIVSGLQNALMISRNYANKMLPVLHEQRHSNIGHALQRLTDPNANFADIIAELIGGTLWENVSPQSKEMLDWGNIMPPVVATPEGLKPSKETWLHKEPEEPTAPATNPFLPKPDNLMIHKQPDLLPGAKVR